MTRNLRPLHNSLIHRLNEKSRGENKKIAFVRRPAEIIAAGQGVSNINYPALDAGFGYG